MKPPEPFNTTLDAFINGSDMSRRAVVDPIFAKTFEMVRKENHSEMKPGEVFVMAGLTKSRFAENFEFADCENGVILMKVRRNGNRLGVKPAGFYAGADLVIDTDCMGMGLGAELVIERCLRDGENPELNHDKPGYSPAGLGAFTAAWRYAQENPREMHERLEAWKG